MTMVLHLELVKQLRAGDTVTVAVFNWSNRSASRTIAMTKKSHIRDYWIDKDLIPTFAMTTDEDGIVVNLYDAGHADLRLTTGPSNI